MKRADADLINQRSYSCAETRNAVSHLQAAESLHEISVKTPTLRDYFAAKAMQAFITGAMSDGTPLRTMDGDDKVAAKAAYIIADAMLKERE
ncbi:hypothetical protein [Enterobacter hormaechei]|uniref:hypothetical protein n=1 Tax=Enterobacter hormaechei TaxID=158836 RepID=UPI0021AE2BBB|nr:hypothetical protein [Enterobacter hormaechei]